jgi:hypothetical protein
MPPDVSVESGAIKPCEDCGYVRQFTADSVCQCGMRPGYGKWKPGDPPIEGTPPKEQTQ